MPFVPIGQFAPDQDKTTGQTFSDCLNVTPTITGYRGAYTAASIGSAALASACLGGIAAKDVGGLTKVYVGIATGLYQYSSGSWVDVTRTTGGAYAATGKWRFCQFGNVTIAVDKDDETQSFEVGATDFENLAGAPKASICESVNEFVFLFGTNEGTYGDEEDRWWCCALGNHTDWTPDIATQCATGRLYDSPGPITAARRIGDYIAVFKERAIYVGTYIGPPFIWNWIRISDTIGASSQEAVINTGQALMFCNKDGVFSFDGTNLVSTSVGRINNWLQDRLDLNYVGNISATIDRPGKIIRWWFPDKGDGGALTSWISYSYAADKFGYGQESIEATLDYAAPALDYDALGALYSTYEDFPNIDFNSRIMIGGAEAPAVIATDHKLMLLDGVCGNASITSGDIGQDGSLSLLRRVRPRYVNTLPTSAALTNYYLDQIGGTYTEDVTTTEVDGKFDLLRTARWHRVKLATTGNFEISGVDVDIATVSPE